MMRALTSDMMLRFFGGFGLGCALVFASTQGLFSGLV